MMKKVAGISLIEMLLVIAIAAVVITGAVQYFELTSQNMRVARTIQQIQTITKASYEWLQGQKQDDFSSENGGTEISMQALIDTGLVKNTATNTKDLWAGDITIKPGSDPNRVKITLSNLPKKVCKNLAQRLDSVSQITEPNCRSKINEYTGEF